LRREAVEVATISDGTWLSGTVGGIIAEELGLIPISPSHPGRREYT
jgi:hypothetical protein